ncbi:MAG: diaminopimelate decarboxylase [Rhodospirillales bacterium]
MDHFQYRAGRLCAEDVALDEIAAAVGTPFYCYAGATLERHYKAFADSVADLDATVCFAVKANSNIAVIATLARLGAGADVVSCGELQRALRGGVPAGKIVFSGVGKSREEITAALDAGVLQINVESEPELELIDEIAAGKGVRAPVAIRINPDVDAHTHEKITTGLSENKFGIEWTRAHAVFRKAAAMKGIAIVGVAVHIGSQLTQLQPFRDAYVRLRDLVAMLRKDGHEIERLDLGGGLGISYGDGRSQADLPGPREYAEVVRSTVGDLGCRLIFEPGRMIAGNAGILVTRILYIKEGATRTFAIVDAAMNDLLRPTLYNAYHAIVPVAEAPAGTSLKEMDVVGPICETGDTFGVRRSLPPLVAGDLLAIRTAGAYGAVMASTYNSRPLVPEVLVHGKDYAVIRARWSVDDMIALESVPAWLKPKGKNT